MKTIQKQVTTTVSHPMEDFLNLPANTTIDTHTERETELIKVHEYDEKDNELEETYQYVYDKAITGYENLADEMASAEVKYMPRLGEVSVSFLKTALDAASLKARLKEHKDKLNVRKNSAKNVTNNNTVIVSREQLLETLRQSSAPVEKPIDVEHKQITTGELNDD